MLSQVVQDALNQQINIELSSSYAYLGMSAYCEHSSFHGFAKWLHEQSKEEYEHGMKLYSFMIARNCRVALQELAAPKSEYGSIPQVFEEALEQEIEVSQKIDGLYELAFKERAFATLVELEWFIKEQVEEEHTFRGIVSKLKLVKDDPSAILDLDREMGARGSSA
jgi:ferritin